MEVIKNQVKITKEATIVIEELMNMNVKPLVVINCIAYNQERYIRDTLEGFVMQKTNFPFIAIVHDDASTDGTAAIIRKYADKYPDIIKPILETENQYSKKNGSLGQIIRKANAAIAAKYTALCEGDDYWTNPDKLQSQVDYLETHPDYSLCFHNVDVISENKKIDLNIFSHLESRIYSKEEVLRKWTVPTCSAVFKTECLLNMPTNKGFRVGDNVQWLTCGRYGKLYCINKKWATYRRIESGWTLQNAYERHKQFISHYKALKESFPEIDVNIYNNRMLSDYARCTIYGIIYRKKDVFPIIKEAFKEYNFKYILKILNLSINKLIHR